MDKRRSLVSSYRIIAAILLVIVFIVGTISTMHHFIDTNFDLLEIVQDGENDIEEDRLHFGDPENDETQILIFISQYRLPPKGGEFNDGVFQVTTHSLLVITPPPELF